jgi:hypothetical protein
MEGHVRGFRPGGTVLLSFHVGDEVRHIEEMLGRTVDVDFQFYERHLVESRLEQANLSVSAYVERPPYRTEVTTTSQGRPLGGAPAMVLATTMTEPSAAGRIGRRLLVGLRRGRAARLLLRCLLRHDGNARNGVLGDELVAGGGRVRCGAGGCYSPG